MDQELIVKLTKDLKAAVGLMTEREARYLVDFYYQSQENRIRSAAQIRSAKDEPHAILAWAEENNCALEKQIASALKCFAESRHMGRWAMEVDGIGPVIAAGLVAHIDITKAPTVGHIWRFAGFDPTSKWEKKTKRPWNAQLKVICWKAWQSWVKLKNNPNCTYARLMFERKAMEWENNLSGKLSEQAKAMLERKAFKKDSNAHAWYSGQVDVEWAREAVKSGEAFPVTVKLGKGIPMLPPAHIASRAGRWAVKLFLAQWHAEAYREHFKTEPPLPYPIAILGHAHLIEAI